VTIKPGQDLLHFHLVEKIGEGGMGVVWKAVDTTLNRDVAIKILPEGFSGEGERLARFEREAKLLASLNHPNIAGIYGIYPSTGSGQAGGLRFLSMELVEGEDLQQRLSRGALSRGEALKLALQIARAFETAHESGVIHRDLKPANVKLTPEGQIKVLDFGLAKALAQDPSGPGGSPSLSPTLTSTGTVAGMVLGTAAYMSPEQAKGREVDRRADIWSFGVVLFEMLTGRRLFDGEGISETLAAVIMKEVDWGGLPADTPPSIRRLLKCCLERDPKSRLRDIGDARIAIEEALRAPEEAQVPAAAASQRPAWLSILPWLVATASLVALAVVWLAPARESDRLPVMRLRLSVPEETRVGVRPLPMLSLSPDGRRLVFVGAGEEDNLLYMRSIDQPTAVALPGTERAQNPIFSPDGQWIAFKQGRELKKVSVMGGPPTRLCDAPRLRGASWGPDGTIVFTPERATGLMRVPDAGGTPELLTTLDHDPADPITPSHRWPEFLLDGRTVLFTSTENDSDYGEAKIVALSLDNLEQKTIVEGASFPRYVPAGFLAFVRGDTLFAARFDPERLELLGPAVPVLEGLATFPFYGSAQLTFSSNGTMAYFEQGGATGQESLVWVSREGEETTASTLPGVFSNAALSPDGRHVAVTQFADGETNIWIVELERDTASRLTFHPSDDGPVWSPDGDWIVFDSMRDSASRNLYRKRANGTGEAERLTTNLRHQYPSSWSPDGKVLAFTETEGDTEADILLLRLEDPPETEVFLKTPFNERDPALSPDGRWIAYVSDESGRPEVYVLPLDGGGGRTKISTEEGYDPKWSPDGRELLYVNDDEKLMSVRVSVEGGVLRPQSPREVIEYPETYGVPFAVSTDGTRFLVDKDVIDTSAGLPEPTVVVNWFDELEAKVPPAGK
jgi:serine/threonine-protein kinase